MSLLILIFFKYFLFGMKLENANARVSADSSEGTQSGYQPSQGTSISS